MGRTQGRGALSSGKRCGWGRRVNGTPCWLVGGARTLTEVVNFFDPVIVLPVMLHYHLSIFLNAVRALAFVAIEIEWSQKCPRIKAAQKVSCLTSRYHHHNRP